MAICGHPETSSSPQQFLLPRTPKTGGWIGSPAPGVADAGGRVPRYCDDLAVAFLNPDRIAVVEVNDGAERRAAVEPVQDLGITGVGGESGLKPGVTGHALRGGEREVFHDADRFSVLAESGVEEAVSSAVLVGIGEGQLVAEGVFLQETEGVADANVVVGSGNEAGAIEVGADHDEQIGGGAGFRGGSRLGSLGLSENYSAQR